MMSSKPIVKNIKPEDIITDSKDNDIENRIKQIEERVNSIERILMRILDTIELDYPSLSL